MMMQDVQSVYGKYFFIESASTLLCTTHLILNIIPNFCKHEDRGAWICCTIMFETAFGTCTFLCFEDVTTLVTFVLPQSCSLLLNFIDTFCLNMDYLLFNCYGVLSVFSRFKFTSLENKIKWESNNTVIKIP